MSIDDDQDCVEHVWVMTGLVFLPPPDGANIDYRCVRCGALMIEGPAEITGRSGTV